VLPEAFVGRDQQSFFFRYKFPDKVIWHPSIWRFPNVQNVMLKIP
jgi:hypothetical protein